MRFPSPRRAAAAPCRTAHGPRARRRGWLLVALCAPGLVAAQGSVATAPGTAANPTAVFAMPAAPAASSAAPATDELDLGAPLRWQGRFPEQTRDTDGDGVTDLDDNCPGTPRGGRVDECGCPVDPCRLDTDHDGVPDCRDRCPATPPGARVNRLDGCPLLPIARRTRVRLDVRFAFDKAIVTAAYGPDIGHLEDLLLRFPELLVTLEGHTDSVGTERYNLRLSWVRAQAVRRALLADGRVAPSRVTAVGFGESRPVADNATAAGRARNRRTVAELSVDYRVTPDDQGVLPPALPEEIPLGALTESLQPAAAPVPPSVPALVPVPASIPAPTSGGRP